MAKRVLILACVGFPVGVLIAFAIAFFSGESMVFYSGLLLSRVGGNTSAATAVNILVCGLYGAACMMGTVFYDIDEWPLLLATVLHYLIVTMGSLACSLLLGWGDGIKGWLVIGAIQTVIFFLIWLCMFLRYKAEVRKLNELNRKERGE